mgnify:FL=1
MTKIVKVLMASLFAVLLSVSFTSCDKEPMEARPELPPMETILMDFSDFSEAPAGAKSTDATYENFLHSFLTLTFWNLASTVTMAVPVAAYGYALQQEPVYLGDLTWEWSFEFDVQGASYNATLTGSRLNNEEFTMEMVIGSASSEAGVKWFDGVVRYDHTHATWKIYEEGTVEILQVEWNKDFVTEESDLRYTYVEPDQNETGSYIQYSYMPEQVYDASFDISHSGGTTDIEWNLATREGRVMDSVKFGDSEWHCWDSDENGLADIDCP